MILGLQPGPLGEGAALAEAAGMDFILLPGDGVLGHDPLSVAAFLMTTTRRIGLAAAVSTDWAPFNVARALASFDNLSGGRCGWRPVRGTDDAAREAEHLEVVLKLFDSWDDDALIFDKANAVFADRAKVRRIRHEGAHFTVDGPLNAPRPPQGWPVLFQPINEATAQGDVALIAWDQLGAVRPDLPTARLLAEVPFASALDDHAIDAMAAAFARGACDGFLFQPAVPQDSEMLIAQVVPRLRPTLAEDRGTLRQRLGLARPVNRYALTGA
jgi:alkanesulfonate monooxygenase SsuD/methylene tetrahydromethanopterin reductase-like flavin-dependent oxidoreductase (luciferase family)